MQLMSPESIESAFEPKGAEKALEDLLGLSPIVLQQNSEMMRKFNDTPDDEIDSAAAHWLISELTYCYFLFPVSIKQGHTIIRGRPVQSGGLLPRIVDLGPPPEDVATAGRANAAGESIFYGASSDETVFAELRLCKGQSANISAWSVRPEGKLLTHVIGEMDHLRRWSRTRFLPSEFGTHVRGVLDRLHPDVALAIQLVDAFLADRFSRVGASAYRVTNLITREFLRSKTIDGVIYESVAHAGGFNYALKRRRAETELQLKACQALEIIEDYGYGSVRAKRYALAKPGIGAASVDWVTANHGQHAAEQIKREILQNEDIGRWMRLT